MQETKTVVLRNAVSLGDVTYAEFVLREPTAGELSKAEAASGGNRIQVSISLISQIAAVPMTVVNKIGQRDLQECTDFLNSFVFDGQETGETSSPS